MDSTWFQSPIECPECGFHTHELFRATSMDDARGKVLMCVGCWEDSEEGQEYWDDEMDDGDEDSLWFP